MNAIARGTNRIALSEPIRNPISAWTTTAVSLLGLILAGALLPSAQAADMVTVRPQEIDDVLVNPGIGFTTFQRFNGDRLNEGLKWTEGFPIEYQEFTGSLTNQDHPLTSIAYFRVTTSSTSP